MVPYVTLNLFSCLDYQEVDKQSTVLAQLNQNILKCGMVVAQQVKSWSTFILYLFYL